MKEADWLTKAQAQLDEAYINAEAECIEKKLDRVGNLSSSIKHAAAWPFINNLTGRKSKPSICIKGESAEKWKESWVPLPKPARGATGQHSREQSSASYPDCQAARYQHITFHHTRDRRHNQILQRQ